MNFFDYLLAAHTALQKDFIVGRGETISYRALYRGSDRLARWLNGQIGEDRPVLVICENSAFFVLVYLAVMKSGNICVPLNPRSPVENFRTIAGITGAVLAVVDRSDKLRGELAGIRILDREQLKKPAESTAPIAPRSAPSFDEQRVAQIIFTSGSTGKPKGVVLSHRNLKANTASIIKSLGLSCEDRMEVVLPFSYCYGLSLLHTHLKVGGSIVLNNHFRFLGSVFDDLQKYRCTGFAGVPSHFQILFRGEDPAIGEKLRHLRYMTQAGGKLTDDHIRTVISRYSGDFYVMYGQTEATARLSILEPERLYDKFGSVGKGIEGVQLDIVDREGNTVSRGTAGEVVARGDNIMIGYFADREATRRTVKNGWLHTGDVGFMDDDGYVFLQGRKKDIIKTGGERVSPHEIREVVLSIPWVADCQVHGIPDDILGELIQASVALKEDLNKDLARKEIISECRGRLALHKVPKRIEFVQYDAIVSGKGMMH